jgi:hypothetical protein
MRPSNLEYWQWLLMALVSGLICADCTSAVWKVQKLGWLFWAIVFGAISLFSVLIALVRFVKRA